MNHSGNLTFIDLFAGLGGFHKALTELGHKCVFASELDPTLRNLYKINWGIEAKGDIKEIVRKEIETIPPHDILCAGFPCQPFSKAGKQLGRDDDRGTLFDEIIKILKFRGPKYFILENVPFIKRHDNEETWNYMNKELSQLGYSVDYQVYSPQDFGIPQHRKRIFIVGSMHGLEHFSFGEIDKQKIPIININQFIEEKPRLLKELPKANQECLKLWQKFIDQIPKNVKLPGSPIWGMEFGATYPFDGTPPQRLPKYELAKYKGNFGKQLTMEMTKKEMMASLPSYARTTKRFPNWKQRYIQQSRDFYIDNEKHIKNVVTEIATYPSQSWQKLEWNVGESERNINNYIIQFRASGIRVKKADFFPSLVCTNTQIPIIGWKNRYITRNEGLRLQSLEGIALPDNDNAAFKALGNAVNAKIVRLIASQLLIEKKKLNGVSKQYQSSNSISTIYEPAK